MEIPWSEVIILKYYLLGILKIIIAFLDKLISFVFMEISF